MKSFKRLTAFVLSLLMSASMSAPALGVTFAVVNTESIFTSGELVSEDGLVHVAYGTDAGIPEGATVSVSEITDSEKYLNTARGMLKDGAKPVYSRFFDIDIVNEKGESVDLQAPVEVSIHIDDAPADSTGVSVFHFSDAHAEEADAGMNEAEIADEEVPLAAPEFSLNAQMSNALTVSEAADGAETADEDSILPEEAEAAGSVEEVRVTGNNEGSVSFLANGFSVYGVVYTVDFSIFVDGQEFAYSITGGSGIPFTELLPALRVIRNDPETENDELWAFIEHIESVSFSNPSLAWVGKAEELISVGELKERNGLICEYSADLTEEQIAELNDKLIPAQDWAFISLAAFDTEESMTIRLNDGQVFTVRVTDAGADAVIVNGQVQTISNPSGTTIDLFDYWVDTAWTVPNNGETGETAVGRRGWPGYDKSYYNRYTNSWVNTTGYDSDFYNHFTNSDTSTNGNNSGINNGHKLKFVPSMSGQVIDYNAKTGADLGASVDGVIDGINSWNGYNQNNQNHYTGVPTQGIVAGALYNSSGSRDNSGYPRLELNDAGNGSAGDSESLAYLFSPDVSHDGKKNYTGTNKLLYVDSEGYYTYDSRFYSATLNPDKTYTVSQQPSGTTEGLKGFWPFGTRNYWYGMHVRTDFSMPANGKVLNPQGEYKPMQFEFSGDDDAWCYVDGILIADGGGVHNRTELDINFETGVVKIVGGSYTDIDDPDMTVISTKTIYQILKDAHDKGLMSNEQWNNYEWNDASNPTTFKAGTYHTFDFFYLERGGGESNLYIHYNLVSTSDFTAHKSLHSQNNTRLARDDFNFEIVGLDGRYEYEEYDDNGTTKKRLVKKAYSHSESGENYTISQENPAIMPMHEGLGSEGTPSVENPIYKTGTETLSDSSIVNAQYYQVGVSEDGNVNFGEADFSNNPLEKTAKDEGHPSVYRYMIRELVPDEAVNDEGVLWRDASPEEKAVGGFTTIKNGEVIYYDHQVYYMTAEVTSWREAKADGSYITLYGLSKKYYTDDTFTEARTDVSFANFLNGAPLKLKIIKKDKDDNNKLLSGAGFSLTRAIKNEEDQWVIRTFVDEHGVVRDAASKTGTTQNGYVTFSDLTDGHYILEETAAPAGYYKADPSRWLLTLETAEVNGKVVIVPTLQGIDDEGNITGTPFTLMVDENNLIESEILNGKIPPSDIEIEKKWYGKDGRQLSAAELEVLDVDNVTITGELWRKYREPRTVTNPTVTFRARKYGDQIMGWPRWTELGSYRVEYGSDFWFSIGANGTSAPDYESTNPSSYIPVLDSTKSKDIDYGGGLKKTNANVFVIEGIKENITVYAEFPDDMVNSTGIKFYTETGWYSPANSTTSTIDGDFTEEKVRDFTLNSSSDWKNLFKNNELKEANGREYEYFLKNVKETPILNGYDFISIPVVTTDVGNKVISFELANQEISTIPDLPEAKFTKTLEPNKKTDGSPDGTYTMTLSVTVPQIHDDEKNRANVVIVYDSSNSMNRALGYMTTPAWSDPVFGKIGGSVDGDGEGYWDQVYKRTGSYVEDLKGVRHYDWEYYIYDREEKDWVEYEAGWGFWVPNPDDGTRMTTTKQIVTDLAKDLLEHNKSDKPTDSPTVELAFVEYATNILHDSDNINRTTADFNTFSGWVNGNSEFPNGCEAPGTSVNDKVGATNWELALKTANSINFGDDDPTYIVFVSDGNPTKRTSSYYYNGTQDPDDPTNESDRVPNTHGNGSSDPYNFNLRAANEQARNIVNSDKYLYAVGIFGDADRMMNLGPRHKYYNANDKNTMKTMFGEIANLISSRLGYSSVVIEDGLTSMTATALVNGPADNFTYKVVDKDGNDVTSEMWAKLGRPEATYEETNKGYEYIVGDQTYEYKYKQKEVVWDLGNKDLLLEGATYSVSFVVWPSQEAYDLVADLNNGLRRFEDLNEIEAAQVELRGGVYVVKTNTHESAKGKISRRTKDGVIPDPDEYVDIPKEVHVDPMPLTDTTVKIRKVWKASLDRTQLEDIKDKEVHLELDKEGVRYIPDIRISAPEPITIPEAGDWIWPEKPTANNPDGVHYISAGLMVSTEAAQKSKLHIFDEEGNPVYPTATFKVSDTETIIYHILEPGRDYEFREVSDSDYRFELKEEKFHPMVVDGVLCDVRFNSDKSVVESKTPAQAGNTVDLSATNELKGGILIYKEVYNVDEETKITTDNTIFKVEVTLSKPDGTPYSVDGSIGGYRIVYGSMRPEEEKDYGDAENLGAVAVADNTNKNRSMRFGIDDGVFTVGIYQDEYIQVANVDRGVTYTVREVEIPTGYENFDIVYEINDAVDSNDIHTVSSEKSHKATVKNKLTLTDFEFSKVWRDSVGESILPWPNDKTIEVTVKQNGTEYAKYSIAPASLAVGKEIPAANGAELPKLTVMSIPETAGGYRFMVNGLLPGYTYTISETPVDGYQSPKYLDAGGTDMGTGYSYAPDGGTIVNDQVGVELPSTGGKGTAAFIIAGAALAIASGGILTLRRTRRKEQ